MEYRFIIQDPSDPNTTYLYESIVQQVTQETLEEWRAIFAFATGSGVRSIFVDDPDVASFIEKKTTNLIVGIDAVTDVSALEELLKLCNSKEDFGAKVFVNESGYLFHPKISHFKHSDGSSVLIVGSGNLTQGGLRGNIEAYLMVKGSDDELERLGVWDDFLNRHAKNIREIDDEAFELARKNKIVGGRRKRKVKEVEPEEEIIPEGEEELEDEEFIHDARVLVARVPGAGGRWHQIHYNRDVIKEFFRIAPHSAQRVFLTEIGLGGSRGPQEIRPLVLSSRNLNLKIEIAARRNEEYPGSETPPIVVLKEMGVRTFDYTLLMPGDRGYEEMMEFTGSHSSFGKGVRRALTTYSEVKSSWENCPL